MPSACPRGLAPIDVNDVHAARSMTPRHASMTGSLRKSSAIPCGLGGPQSSIFRYMCRHPKCAYRDNISEVIDHPRDWCQRQYTFWTMMFPCTYTIPRSLRNSPRVCVRACACALSSEYFHSSSTCRWRSSSTMETHRRRCGGERGNIFALQPTSGRSYVCPSVRKKHVVGLKLSLFVHVPANPPCTPSFSFPSASKDIFKSILYQAPHIERPRQRDGGS